MYDRYQEGIAKGLKPIELIDPTNKNYIAKDYLSYKVDKNEVFKEMMKKVKKVMLMNLKKDYQMKQMNTLKRMNQ